MDIKASACGRFVVVVGEHAHVLTVEEAKGVREAYVDKAHEFHRANLPDCAAYERTMAASFELAIVRCEMLAEPRKAAEQKGVDK